MHTKTRGTGRVPPASQKPKTIVGLDRLNWRNADGRPSFKCERPDCPNVVEQSPRGRRRKFCSERCRKAVARSRVTCPENAPKARTAGYPRGANFRTKHRSEINELQRPKSDRQKPSLSWVRVNEVTWKLTDGKMSRTPASHGQWGGYDTERAIAWVCNRGWSFGRNDWYAYCGKKKIGPTDFNSARAASRALANVTSVDRYNADGAICSQIVEGA
jgi:hypothetical protein